MPHTTRRGWLAVPLALIVLLSLLNSGAAGAQAGTPEGGPPTEVVGGQPADPGEYPWQVALVIAERYEPNPFLGLDCGGSLISPDTVITAAHCVAGAPPNFFDVVVGTIDLIPGSGERIPVRRVRVHPHFSFFTELNDVAILELSRDATLGTPIDVAQPGDEALWAPGTIARFTGWGADEQGNPVSRLQEAEAPTISDATCQARYLTLFRGRTMLCAGDISATGGDVSPCFGDSGGPLTVPDGGDRLLVGLVAWGFDCGDPNYPPVFTEVSTVSNFVNRYLDPDEVPGPVRDLQVQRVGSNGREARVSWKPPGFDGGTALIRYVIIAGGHQTVAPAGTRSTRITGLPAGATHVSVAAQNPIGIGPATTVRVPPA